MSITVHFGKVAEMVHHCIHDDGTVTLRVENASGGVGYLQMTPDVSEAVREAFNKATAEREEKLRTYTREQLIAEDV